MQLPFTPGSLGSEVTKNMVVKSKLYIVHFDWDATVSLDLLSFKGQAKFSEQMAGSRKLVADFKIYFLQQVVERCGGEDEEVAP